MTVGILVLRGRREEKREREDKREQWREGRKGMRSESVHDIQHRGGVQLSGYEQT